MVQRRAARWVLNRYDRLDSVNDMLYCLNWKTLQSRRSIARLSMLYKMRNNLTYADKNMLQPVSYKSTRSSEHAYKLPTASCDYFKFSVYPRTLLAWNQLPRDITLSKSLVLFKEAISNFY